MHFISFHRPTCKTTFERLTQSQAISQSFLLPAVCSTYYSLLVGMYRRVPVDCGVTFCLICTNKVLLDRAPFTNLDSLFLKTRSKMRMLWPLEVGKAKGRCGFAYLALRSWGGSRACTALCAAIILKVVYSPTSIVRRPSIFPMRQSTLSAPVKWHRSFWQRSRVELWLQLRDLEDEQTHTYETLFSR